MGNSRNSFLVLVAAGAVALGLPTAPASAFEFARTLRPGQQGKDVRALQVRVAGWLERADQRRLRLTGVFDGKTENALTAFKAHYGLGGRGLAGKKVFEVLARLEDKDGSTRHFAWNEFDQNYNSGCSRKANRFAGTFKGGKASRRRVRANVQMLMWRLEALRAKMGDKPIVINSGFRSVAYNRCIGGASLSQHMYGTAADLRVIHRSNRRVRNRSKRTQVHGIACYSGFTHNHVDLRLHNEDLAAAQYWWWPERDARGRDLDENGAPCWGETRQTKRVRPASLQAPRALDPSFASFAPGRAEGEAFEDGVEPFYGGLAD